MKAKNYFIPFALSCVWGFGAIGGTLVAITSGYWLIGIGVAGLGAIAYPYLKSKWNQLDDENKD